MEVWFRLTGMSLPVLTMGQSVVIHKVHAEAIHSKKVQANKQRNYDVFVVYLIMLGFISSCPYPVGARSGL